MVLQVAAILSHSQIISLPAEDAADELRGATADEKDLRLVHNLAQFCHCCAQGKIGSGFDVAAAVYGSMEYVRFSPEVRRVG